MRKIFSSKTRWFVALLLAAALVFGFASCSSDSDDDDTSSANTQTNSSTTSNSNSSSGSSNSENSSGSDNGGSSSSGTTTPDTTQETTADDTEDLSNAGSSSVTLPESSGENPFLNKTFKSNYDSFAFGSSYVTYTQFVSNGNRIWDDMCSLGDSAIFSYSYDDNKGLLYLKLLKWGDYTSAADYNPESQKARAQLERDDAQALFNTLIVYEVDTDGTTLRLKPYCGNDIVLPSLARFFYRASSPQPNTLCDIYCSYGIRLLENEKNAEGFTSTGIEYYVYPTFNGNTFSGNLYKYNRRSLYDDVTKVGSVSGTWSYAWDNNGIRLKFTSIDCDLLSTDEEYVLKPFSNSNVEYTLEE